jgi:hypothetical protein
MNLRNANTDRFSNIIARSTLKPEFNLLHIPKITELGSKYLHILRSSAQPIDK